MIEAVVTTGDIRCAKFQCKRDHQQTNTQFILQAGCRSCHPTNSKGKGKWIYIAPLLKYLTLKVLRYGSRSVTCKLHRTCLYLVSIHQMAHPQTEVADI